MNARIVSCAWLACACLLSGCAYDTESASEEALGEQAQALSDVPGLRVRAWSPVGSDQGHFQGQCQTSYKDSTHRLQVLCQVQQYYDGAWHADPYGWMENQDVATGVLAVPRRPCTPGTSLTLRTIARGRVLWSGGWSDIEEDISSTSKVVCPR